MRATEAVARGFVAHPDALNEVREVRDARGGRIIEVHIADGWRLDVMVDRGLDIGTAWFRGSPVSWRSPVDVDPGPGAGWKDRFLGGLLATCGTENIGPAHDDVPLHGTHHLTPARVTHVERVEHDGLLGVALRGRIMSADLGGRKVQVDRLIEVVGPRITVRDVVSNLGPQAVVAALLYHVNFGYPLVDTGTAVAAPGRNATARPDNPDHFTPWTILEPSADSPPAMFLLDVAEDASAGTATVTAHSGYAAELVWSAASLPYLYEWQWPRQNVAVLALEPANSPAFGIEREAPNAGAHILQPGVSVATSLTVTVGGTYLS